MKHISRALRFAVSAILMGIPLLLSPGCSLESGMSPGAAPAVESSFPPPDTLDVPTSSNVTVAFTRPVARVDNTTTTFTLTRLGSISQVPAHVHYDSDTDTATLDPDDELETDSIYIVRLSRDIIAYNRKHLADAPVVWIFTTGAAPDTDIPTVSSRAPYAGQLNVPAGTAITVRFSENVVNVNDTTFTLVKASDQTPVTGVVDYDQDTLTATFTPADDLGDGTQYTVKLTGGINGITDGSGNELVTLEWAFRTADITAPTVQSRTPGPGTTDIPQNTNITVVFSEPVSNVTNTTFTLMNGTLLEPANVIYNPSTNTATLDPSNASLDPDTVYTVTLKGGADVNVIKDLNGNALASDVVWTFTTMAAPDIITPVIVDRGPASGATNINISANVEVQFSESVVGVNASSFTLKPTAGAPISAVVTYDDGAKLATLNPSTSLIQGTEYTVTLTDDITDLAANPIAPATWTFTTEDITPPTVTDNNPLDGETGISKSIVVFASFSEPVAGVDETSFTLVDADSDPVPATVYYNQITREATLTPVVILDSNMEFTVTLTSDITDTSFNHNPLAETSWSFTTSIDLDTTPPSVVITSPGNTVSPYNNETNVAINTNITATFSEPVIGVGPTSFVLKKGATTIPTLVSYNTLSRTATLEPESVLEGNTVYTVTLTDDITDLANPTPNTLTETTWSFTTRPDTTAPTVMTRIPADGATNVDIDTSIIVTFSEAVVNVAANFKLFRVSDMSEVPSTVAWDDTIKAWRLTPSELLRQGTGTQYRAILYSGITDTATPSNALLQTSWNFTTVPDTTAPVVFSGSEYPGEGDTGVALNTNINVSFSEPVRSVSGTTFTMKPQSGSNIAGTVTYDEGSNSATFDPASNLSASTTYVVTLIGGVTGIKDYGDNPLSVDPSNPGYPNYQWSFTTGAVLDTTPPAISSRTPSVNQTNVATNLTAVTVVFDEPVTGISLSSFTLKQGTSLIQPVSEPGYDPGSRTATYTLKYNLERNTVYTVRLTGSITDTAGNPLSGAPVSWNFTTSTTDGIRPAVLSTIPVTAGQPVTVVKPTIEAVFSESVTGVNASNFTLSPAAAADIYYEDTTKTATLIPRASLADNTVYTITLTAGIADLSGNTLTAYSWDFRTATAPKVSSVSPTDGTMGVSVSTAYITINFDNNMDPDSGLAVLSGGGATLGTGEWTSATSVRYPVIGTLYPSTPYTVTLFSWWQPFSDADGNLLNSVYNASTNNVLGANMVLNFTTGTDASQPVVLDAIPNENSSLSSLNPRIVVKFSKRMDTSRTATLTPSGTLNSPVWLDGNKTAVYTPTGLAAGTTYHVNFTAFRDTSSNTLDGTPVLGDGILDFTLNASAVSTLLSYGFEYDFSSGSCPFQNSTGDVDDYDLSSFSISPAAIPWEGSYMLRARTLEWIPGDEADLDLKSPLNFAATGLNTILLSFNLVHDQYYPADDRLEIWVNYGSGYVQVPNTTVYRHDPLFTSTTVTTVTTFDPSSYTSATGYVAVPDSVNLSTTVKGDIFRDAGGTLFPIGGGISNVPGSKRFYIGTGLTVNTGNGATIRRTLWWGRHDIDLSMYSSQSSVYIRLKAVSSGEVGSNILVDDLSVKGY